MGPATTYTLPHERDILRCYLNRSHVTVYVESEALSASGSFQRLGGRNICYGVFRGAQALDVDFLSS